MKINVTQEDIDQGVPLSVLSCPVALAVRRAFGVHYASVGPVFITVEESVNDFDTYDTPANVSTFIEDFDTDQATVQPFSFELPTTGD